VKVNKVRCRFITSLVATFLAMAVTATAQETRGRITGQVVDSTKAAIPGASVTVTDQARGTSAFSTTNAEGLFQANYLLSGMYEVTVELAGFKKYIQRGVSVSISETRDLRITLEVGSVEEAVSVTADAAAINTSDASLGLTIDAKRLAELPLIHGDPYKLMGLAAGVTHSGSQRLGTLRPRVTACH